MTELIAIDYLLLGVVALSAVIGLIRGFLKESLSLVIWVAAIWCAWRFGQTVAQQLPDFVAEPVLKLWATRFLVLACILLIGGIVSWLLGLLLGLTHLTGTDRMVGMVFGLARGAVLAGVLVVMMEAAGFDAGAWWQESKLIPYAAPIATVLRDAAGNGLAQLQTG